jgi:hypothetical protein
LKLKTILEFGGVLGVAGKPSVIQILIEVISKISELRCKKY